VTSSAVVFLEEKLLPNVVVDNFVVRRNVLDEFEEFLPQLVRFDLNTYNA
jgi:predicted RNA-binding protein